MVSEIVLTSKLLIEKKKIAFDLSITIEIKTKLSSLIFFKVSKASSSVSK